MTRTYGVNKEYAIERALAHTRKYGRAHLCMVYQRSKFDATMFIAATEVEERQNYIDVSDVLAEPALGILGAIQNFNDAGITTEEIPF